MTPLLGEEMFERTCRTCLTTNGEMVSIFSSGFYVDHLPKKLMAFTKVEISNNDHLPKVICKKCMFMADSFYCFKQQCESADNQLKLLLRKNLEIAKVNVSSNQENQRNEVTPTINKSGLNPLRSTLKNGLQPVSRNLKLNDEVDDHVYVDIEYISEEVRINVENALKRRREAEQRIGMEKVSNTIKNLKGIEVVPISNVAVDCSAGNVETKKEEIVVFSVPSRKVKRSNDVETLVADNSATPLSKKLRLPPEITVSKINGNNLKNNDFVIYGKHKKLNFSTIRRIVKIDDRQGCSELKEESIDKDQDDEVVVVSDDSDSQNPKDCKTGSNTSSKNQDLHILGNEFVQIHPKHENQVLNTSTQLIDAVSADIENSVFHDTKIINENVKISSRQESEDLKMPEVPFNLKNRPPSREIASLSTGIDDQYVGYINRTEKTLHASSLKIDSKNRKDKSNKVSMEIQAKNIADDATESLYLCTKSYFKSKKKNNHLLSDFKTTRNQTTTPLAALRVNSSLKVERTSNPNIDQRIDSKNVKENPFLNSNSKFYQCTICLTNFNSMPEVLKHNIQAHMLNKLSYDCLVCDKSYEDKKSLCDHVEEHNSAKPFRCMFCPKAFWLKRSLRKHVNDHINFEPYQCNICLKKFTDKHSLYSHSVLHTANSPFACASCNITFKSKTNWKRHLLTVHENLLTLLCKFCNKKLPSRRSLRAHTRVHTGERPFQCPHCDKRFTQQCNLNTHIHCHLNDRPFVCPHCGKGFNRRGTRDDHVLTHTGVKRHKCTVCDASFTVPSALKRHLWIHTDKARPYSCEKCKLRFIGLYSLRKHLKARHGQFVQLKYPRIERVVVQNEWNEEDRGSNNNVTGSGPQDIVQASDAVEITTKENDCLSPNMNKFEDLPIANFETKIEGSEEKSDAEYHNFVSHASFDVS